ncbi:MAG TPA: DNA polymerase III subunit beta [Chlamydiales bacterium]|jgi:DNA polymerase-3 subunit beta
MIAVVSKADLVSMIGKIQSIAAHKAAVPVLATILIEAIDDQVIVSATDLTVSMRCFMPAKVVQEGAIALPGKKLFQLIRELTAPQIKISVNTSEIAEITAGSSVFKIHGMNKVEFPIMPDLSNAPKIQLSSSSLKEMLLKTAFSAAREDSRYMLNGVQLSVAYQQLHFIGTDGKRLAKVSSSVSIDPSIQGQYVIPLKAVEEMGKILSDSDAKITISIASDKISLESESQLLVTKLLSGQYPDVERVIPSNVVHQFAIHREELMTLLRQVSLFTTELSGSARFVFETGQLSLSAQNSEIGEGRVSMPVDFAGHRFEIAFNPFYLLDILRHSKDETVKIGLTDSHSPGLITDSTAALFVLMPMRLAEAAPARKEAEAALNLS